MTHSTKCRKSVSVVLLLVMTAVMAACGGGGSNGSGSVSSISGAVTFPVATDAVAKRAAAAVTAPVVVEIHGLDGKVIGTPINLESTQGQLTYSYSFANLPSGVDYVIKVKRGAQILKKLVEKKDVVAGIVAGQTVDAISTAVVVIASRQLSSQGSTVVLGEPLPSGAATADLSTKIFATVKPSAIITIITSAQAGGHEGLSADSAAYANVLNLVVAASLDGTVGSVENLTASSTLMVLLFDTVHPTLPAVSTSVSASTAAVMINSAPGTPPSGADLAPVYVAQAKASLSKQDIANAGKYYELALASDPNNAEANMGGAITSGLLMLDDPDFKAVAARWDVVYPSVTQVVQGTSPIKVPFGNLSSVTVQLGGATTSLAKSVAAVPAGRAAVSRALATLKAFQTKLPQQKAGFRSLAKELGMVPVNPPTVSEMQTVIDNVIIPRFDKILGRLAKIEGKANNTFTITKEMQGNSYGDDVVLRDGEYYALDAALNVFQVLFKISTSYNFDVSAGYSYDTIAQNPLAMINDPTVFTLKTGGGAKMAAALGYAKAAAAKTKLAFDSINSRAAGIGALNFTDWAAADKTQFSQTLADVSAALSGPTTITLNAKQIAVDFTKFFSNPPTRSNLPGFGYDVPRSAALSVTYGRPVAAERTINAGTNYSYLTTVDCKIVPTSNIPDFTVNGILPNNSPSNNIADFTALLPVLGGKIVSIEAGGDISPYLYWSRSYLSGKFFFFSNSGLTSQAKVLDTTTGIMSTYFTSIASIPSGKTYQGLSYWNSPADNYALLNSSANGTTTYGFYPITVVNNVLQIDPTPVKTITVGPGRTSFKTDSTGNVYDVNQTSTSYTLYGTDNASVLLTLDPTQQSLFNIRDGFINVIDKYSNTIQQFQINAAGTGVLPVGTFVNVSYNFTSYSTSEFNQILSGGGGYFWVFDGNKMIQYAGKADGTAY
jgi:hypothetical protein